MMTTNEHIRRSVALLPVVSELRKVLPSGASGAEVGSLAGESTLAWCASGMFRRLYCIDLWDGSLYSDPAKSITLSSWDEKKWGEAEGAFDGLASLFPVVRKMKMSSVAAAKLCESWAASLDFVYIDAMHDYDSVCEDIRAWWPLLRVGGVMGGHDFSMKNFPGVVRAVTELVGPVKMFPDKSWLALELRGGDRLKK